MGDGESSSQLRRRRIAGNPNLALNLEAGYLINEGTSQATPSPSYSKLTPSATPNTARLLHEFRSKAQSFDVQIEECEEEEIILDSDEETEAEVEEDAAAVVINRPTTPTPVQDFGTNVVYIEGPQTSDFLKVNAIEHDCYTDVSDADSEEENEA